MSCSMCTFVNEPGVQQCAICDTPLGGTVVLKVEEESAGKADGWACSACTFQNAPNVKHCAICMTPNKAKAAKIHPSGDYLSVGTNVVVGKRQGVLAVDNMDGTWEVVYDDGGEGIVPECEMVAVPSESSPPVKINDLHAQRVKYEMEKADSKEASSLGVLPEAFTGKCTVTLKRCNLTLNFMTLNLFGPLSTGASLWPAEVLLAEVVAAHFKPAIQANNPRPRALELGCGACPAAGLTAQALGYDVVLTDVPDVLRAAQQNAALNRKAVEMAAQGGLTPGLLDGDKLIWGDPVSNVIKAYRPYDLILSADCIFREEFHRPLALTFATLLSTNSNVISYSSDDSESSSNSSGSNSSGSSSGDSSSVEIKASPTVHRVVPVILLAYQRRQPSDDLFVSDVLPKFGLQAIPMVLEAGFVECSAAMSWPEKQGADDASSFKVFVVTQHN